MLSDASLRATKATDVDDLMSRRRAEFAGYKRPGGIRFIALDDFPRSTSGRIQRRELEARLAADGKENG